MVRALLRPLLRLLRPLPSRTLLQRKLLSLPRCIPFRGQGWQLYRLERYGRHRQVRGQLLQRKQGRRKRLIQRDFLLLRVRADPTPAAAVPTPAAAAPRRVPAVPIPAAVLPVQAVPPVRAPAPATAAAVAADTVEAAAVTAAVVAAATAAAVAEAVAAGSFTFNSAKQ